MTTIPTVDTKTKIPFELYVTLQYDAQAPDTPLGFMSPYEPNTSGFKKRQKTQLDWAYESMYYNTTFTAHNWYFQEYYYHKPLTLRYMLDETTGEVQFYKWVEDPSLPPLVVDKERYGARGTNPLPDTIPGRSKQLVSEQDNEPLFPQVYSNDKPLSGFQLTKEVRRTYWGGGNVVWRILDPRGFQLEISSANLARILDCSTVINGVIQEPCIWGRNGAANVLLPISSDIYQAAKVNTIREVSKPISLKEVQLGDIVRISHSRYMPNVEYEYLGKMSIVACSYRNDNSSYLRNTINASGIVIGEKTQYFDRIFERYVFVRTDLKNDREKYIFISTPKITEIVSRIETPKNKKEVIDDLNTKILEDSLSSKNIDSYSFPNINICGFVQGIVKHNTHSLYLEEIVDTYSIQRYFEQVNENHIDSKNNFTSYFYEVNNKLYMTAIYQYEIIFIECRIRYNSILFEQDRSVLPSRQSYYHDGSMYEIRRKSLNEMEQQKLFDKGKWFRLGMDINNQKLSLPLHEINNFVTR